uniref:C2H2-type domain-containing protein n=1 Tax=Neogobius melanostomus TaxID=47308 RepID=A0A8C6UMT7_9GOBI
SRRCNSYRWTLSLRLWRSWAGSRAGLRDQTHVRGPDVPHQTRPRSGSRTGPRPRSGTWVRTGDRQLHGEQVCVFHRWSFALCVYLFICLSVVLRSRPLSVEELPVLIAPPVGEEPCDLRRSLRKTSERLKERPRFGRTFTCDDCGFVFSCEKLLIEHILTCTNRRNPPRDEGQPRPQPRPLSSESDDARVKAEPEDWAEPGGATVTVKTEPQDAEPGGSKNQEQNPDSAKRIKLEPGPEVDQDPEQDPDQDPDQDPEESHCELCGLELKGGDLAAHYLSDHTSHMCACGRCGQVLPKGRRLQEHAQRCAQSQSGPTQDETPPPNQTPPLQDHPENPEDESDDEDHEDHEEEEMEGCPLLDTAENAGASLAGLAPAAFPLDEPRRRHFCGICGRGFFQRCHLREHYTVHTKHKQFTCVTCGKGFLRQRQLRLHQDMHQGVARYVCPVCEQGTFLKQDHVRHMISHLSPGKPSARCASRCSRGRSLWSSTWRFTCTSAPSAARSSD